MADAKLVNLRAMTIEAALRDGLGSPPDLTLDVAAALGRFSDDPFQVLAAWIEACLQTTQRDGQA